MTIQLLNGLVYGGLMYILSVGLVLIFGLRRIVNFAHGSLFMIGAYIGYTVAAYAGFLAGLGASILAMALIGLLLDIGVFRPLQKYDPLLTVLVTFGMLLIFEDASRTLWGKDYISVAVPPFLSGNVEMWGSSYPLYRLLVIAVSFVTVASLSLWLRYSDIGLYVRASSADSVTTGMQGVNTDRVSAIVVAVGAALAGMSGVIASPLMALSPAMGGYILVDSFIVVVVGGLSSFGGAFLAAMLLGQIHNFGIVYLPNVASATPFLLMIAVLIWRPNGFSGQSAATSVETPHAVASPQLIKPKGGRGRWVSAVSLALVSILMGAALPHWVTGPTTITLLTQGALNAILAVSVGLLIRQCGLVSFGHATFFGLGAYLTGILLKNGDIPTGLILLLAILIPTVLGFLMALVIVRLSGVAFSMLTLAVAQVFHEIFLKWRGLAGGDDGLSVTLPLSLVGIPSKLFQSANSMFVICWTLLTLILCGLWLFSGSRLGRLVHAIRDNEERAQFIGYETLLPRVFVFAMSAAIGATGGTLFFLYNGFVSPELLHWTMSGSALVMAIVGGADFVVGPAIGAMTFLGVKDVLGNLTEHWQSIIGAALIMITVGWPSGLAGILALAWRRATGLARSPTSPATGEAA